MKFDIHIHTSYSDGAGSPEDVIKQAKKIGLDGIEITDHDNFNGFFIAKKYGSENFKIIPGVEITSLEGHILCLDATPAVEPLTPAVEVIEKIHASGGIAIAAHPYDVFRGGVGDLIRKLKFDGIEVKNGRTIMSSKNVEDIKRIADEMHITKTGGSDAHSLLEIGNIQLEVNEDPIEAIKKGNVEVITGDKFKRKIDYVKSFF